MVTKYDIELVDKTFDQTIIQTYPTIEFTLGKKSLFVDFQFFVRRLTGLKNTLFLSD